LSDNAADLLRLLVEPHLQVDTREQVCATQFNDEKNIE
jgi:hypothetical protein